MSDCLVLVLCLAWSQEGQVRGGEVRQGGEGNKKGTSPASDYGGCLEFHPPRMCLGVFPVEEPGIRATYPLTLHSPLVGGFF